jgi:hypothetical protein
MQYPAWQSVHDQEGSALRQGKKSVGRVSERRTLKTGLSQLPRPDF